MSNTKQKVVLYTNHASIADIFEDIHEYINDGWRVHTCLERKNNVFIIYEKELDS